MSKIVIFCFDFGSPYSYMAYKYLNVIEDKEATIEMKPVLVGAIHKATGNQSPVMIKNKGTDQLVYATELGEIRSVNPKDGKTNWVYYNGDFSGWTEEDNRLFFKIRAYATSGYIYMEKPLLKDVNGDGVVDLFYQSVRPSESCIEVIDGASGKLIWESFDEEKSAYGFNKINKLPNGNIIEFQKVPNDNIPSYKRKAIAKLFNNQGVVISSYELDALSCWQGASSCLTEKSLIVPFTNKIFEFDNTLSLKEHNFNFPIIYHSEYWGDYKDNSFKADFVSSGVFRYRDYKNCIAVLTERMVATDGTSSKAAVTIYSLDQEKVIDHLILPAISEFPPVIRDVNGDGRLNMLVSCRDGYLYCFDLELSSNDLVSQ